MNFESDRTGSSQKLTADAATLLAKVDGSSGRTGRRVSHQ